ncbi:MAG: dihydroorotate dehydrogenase [Candidatus Omnitrophica bacterium]|nr:dihydroorotate dehydrogenase [Candidatus Omnitrophota bacterium]
MKPKLNVEIGRLKLKNPVMVASGTFGYGLEFENVAGIGALGAVVTKTITLHRRVGNKPPRIAETPSGMLNSIGLENPGVDIFVNEKLKDLSKFKVPIVVSIAGDTVEEYGQLAGALEGINSIDALEINISCPNLHSGLLFAQEAGTTARVVEAVRSNTKKTVITKLSPNVTDITPIARAAEEAGSDAISLINTLMAMTVDIKEKVSTLGSVTGGLSGPAIMPIALYMIWRTARTVKIPIIGMGGIMGWEDAVAFMMCGASAVSIGTANFVNPSTAEEVIEGMAAYLRRHGIKDINALVGTLRT